MSKRVGEAGTQSCHKPHPWCDTPWSGENSKSELQTEEQRVWTPHQAPPTLRPASERWAPESSSFENQHASHPQDLQGYSGTKNGSKRTPALRLTCLRAQYTSSQLRGTGHCVGDTHLLVLECWPEQQVFDIRHTWEPVGVLSRDRSWQVQSSCSPSTLLQLMNDIF